MNGTRRMRSQYEIELYRNIAKEISAYYHNNSTPKRIASEFIDVLNSKGISYSAQEWSKCYNLHDDKRKKIPLHILKAFSEYSEIELSKLMGIENNTATNRKTADSFSNAVALFLDFFIQDKRNFTYDLNDDNWYIKELNKFIDKKKYYIYYPLLIDSKCKKTHNDFRKGTITFEREAEICKITMTLEHKSEIQPCIVYTGFVVIARSRECVYCILYGNEHKPELSFFSFRMRQNADDTNHDCRICLSITCDPKTSRPTAHRILLTKEEIKSDDVKFIIPHIAFNDSFYMLAKEHALNFPNDSSNETICISEEALINHYINEDNPQQKIANIMNLAETKYYQKISGKADSHIHLLLRELGYYK